MQNNVTTDGIPSANLGGLTRITRTAVARSCAICERSLLMGERVVRFAPYAGGDLVDVCLLCQEEALESGWLKEGAPTTPLVPDERRRRSALDLRTIFGNRRSPEPVASERSEERRVGKEC